jgi:hypothetical protein
MGERYSLLPSQVAEHATIFDIMATDVKNSWEDYHRATPEQRAKLVEQSMKTEDLLAIVEKFNGKPE